jgi:ABC-type sugar transport system permease subunit
VKKGSQILTDNGYSFVLTIPAVILTVGFIVVPIIQSIIMSLEK